SLSNSARPTMSTTAPSRPGARAGRVKAGVGYEVMVTRVCGQNETVTEIDAVRGDITTQRVDAIVNAANNSLLGGGGVDGAIHRAGGPAILEACRDLRRTTLLDGLPTGAAVATTAGRLPASHVIHTVGPVWSAQEDRSHLLHSAYLESLRVAEGLDAT